MADEEELSAAARLFQHFLPGRRSHSFAVQELCTLRYHFAQRGSADRVAANSRVLASTWRLPFHTELDTMPAHQSQSAEDVRATFRRLDLLGEGRLTFLSLRTALALADVQEPETRIREWLRLYDRGGKGYVDVTDFQAIFALRSAIAADSGLEGGKGMRDAAMDTTARRAFLQQARQSMQSASLRSGATTSSVETDEAAATKQRDRLAALRALFRRYDSDGDGLLSARDLALSLERGADSFDDTGAQSRGGGGLSFKDCEDWIRKRDRSGTGVLTFEDFAFYYL